MIQTIEPYDLNQDGDAIVSDLFQAKRRENFKKKLLGELFR